MPKLIHYRNNCIGCGVCYEMQPALWRMSKKDGKATLVKAVRKKEVFVLEVPVHLAEESAGVVQACPVRVIKLS